VLLAVVGGVLWFGFRIAAGVARRQRRRECPACGKFERRGELRCSGCGFSFQRAVRMR